MAASCLPWTATACGDDLEPARPSSSAGSDPAYRVERMRRWLLVGDGLTPGHETLDIQVFAPDGVDRIDAWIDDTRVGLDRGPDGDFRAAIDAGALAVGEHEVVLAADGADAGFARAPVTRSHPLYVAVSTDWDDADNPNRSLVLQQELHELHPELRLTHFVGPYTFTDPAVSSARRQVLVDWLLDMRGAHGDEIGLHIHPWCNFVEQAGVSCRTEPSTVYADGDPTGYTVMCAAYTDEEFAALLGAADALFQEAGLGKPTSFRAGGWTASLGTLRALAGAGYVADSSANNWRRMEEWEGVENGVLYQWNREHWASIDDVSQPYYPSESDILRDDDPHGSVLEVPDNGILVDYVTGEEMIEIFDANWAAGTSLAAPRAYSIGYHPPNFNETYQERILMALSHVDEFLAARDSGPVVYATVSELSQVWVPR